MSKAAVPCPARSTLFTGPLVESVGWYPAAILNINERDRLDLLKTVFDQSWISLTNKLATAVYLGPTGLALFFEWLTQHPELARIVMRGWSRCFNDPAVPQEQARVALANPGVQRTLVSLRGLAETHLAYGTLPAEA